MLHRIIPSFSKASIDQMSKTRLENQKSKSSCFLKKKKKSLAQHENYRLKAFPYRLKARCHKRDTNDNKIGQNDSLSFSSTGLDNLISFSLTHTQYFKTRCHKRDTADNKIGQFDHQSSSEKKKSNSNWEL